MSDSVYVHVHQLSCFYGAENYVSAHSGRSLNILEYIMRSKSYFILDVSHVRQFSQGSMRLMDLDEIKSGICRWLVSTSECYLTDCHSSLRYTT